LDGQHEQARFFNRFQGPYNENHGGRVRQIPFGIDDRMASTPMRFTFYPGFVYMNRYVFDMPGTAISITIGSGPFILYEGQDVCQRHERP